jgi:hypothetical protein
MFQKTQVFASISYTFASWGSVVLSSLQDTVLSSVFGTSSALEKALWSTEAGLVDLQTNTALQEGRSHRQVLFSIPWREYSNQSRTGCDVSRLVVTYQCFGGTCRRQYYMIVAFMVTICSEVFVGQWMKSTSIFWRVSLYAVAPVGGSCWNSWEHTLWV